MKKQILSACLLGISLLGCEKNELPPSVKTANIATRQAPIALLPPPSDKVKPVEEVAKEATLSEKVEVKSEFQLALAHENTRGVDHFAQSKSLKEQGDLVSALTEARRALFDVPNDEEVLQSVASLAQKTKQHEVAIAAFERLAELRPDDAIPLIQKARTHMRLKQFTEAVEVGTQGMSRDPQNVESYQVVGRAHLSLGQLEKAILLFEKAVEIEPNHGFALNNLGFAYLQSNQNEKALEVLEKSAELLPHQAFVQNNLGVALERNGKKEEAQAAFELAMTLSPKYIKAIINSKRVAQAMTPIEQTVEETPTGPTSDSESVTP